MTEDELEGRLASLDAKLTTLLEIMGDQRARKEWYTTAELAAILGKSDYTVREWARLRRIKATKRMTGHGRSLDWAISDEELTRIRNEGLLPLRLE